VIGVKHLANANLKGDDELFLGFKVTRYFTYVIICSVIERPLT
jgi:hypothetical protein